MKNFDGNFDIYALMTLFIGILSACVLVLSIQWMKNKRSPRIVVQAKVLHLGIHQYGYSRKRYAAPGREKRAGKLYYAVFGAEEGEQIELRVGKLEYYQLQEGSTGKLIFQGTKYIGFEKHNNQ